MHCISCGKEMAAQTSFCEFCGAPQNTQNTENAQSAQEQAQQQSAANNNSYYTENRFNSYGQGAAQANDAPDGYAYTYAPPGGYAPYAPDENDRPMTVGGWIKTFLILCIPLVNFIMIFVWAFGDGNTSRKNFFRAYLLLILIIFGAALLLGLFIGIGAGISGSSGSASMITQGV